MTRPVPRPADVLPRRGHRRRGRFPLTKLVLLGLPAALLLLLLLVVVAYVRTEVPPPDKLATAGVTVVRFSDGAELGRVGGQNRQPVELDVVPQHVRDAILAAEDRGHYENPGISPTGILRALFTNVRGGGEIQQGGSTITQQYAKNAFLSSERTYTRKVKEILISLKMTREKSKDQILEDYLNTIYFGRGAYGIQVASRTYFGKTVDQLRVEEAAVLAAVIRSPANYDPEKHPERAQERWRYVMDGMVDTGTLGQAERAVLEFPPTKTIAEAEKANDFSGPKGHVLRRVMDEVETELAELGLSSALNAGLDVTTTLRREAQEAAVEAVQEVVGTPAEEDKLAPKGALVSIEPETGAVVAYYGGATGTGFDYAAQGTGRQPGSSFKPFALAAALEEGISLRSTFDGNSPKKFPGLKEPVENFDERDYGRVSLQEATEKSVNTAYFELGLEVGPDKVADLATRAGITTPLGQPDTEAGISLGIYDVKVIDQAAAYAAFANGGERVTPYLVTAFGDGKRELYRAEPAKERAFEEDVAADVTAALQGVVQRGTGTRAKLAGGRPAAGKTGTTSNNYDVWFAGYTPQLSTAIWVGTGQNESLQVAGVREATGGVVAARIWKDYTDAASKGLPVERFPKPANIGKARNGSSTSDDDDEETTRTRAPRPRRSSAPATTEPEQTVEETQAPEPVETTSRPTGRPTPRPTLTVPEDPDPEPSPTGGGGGGGTTTSPAPG